MHGDLKPDNFLMQSPESDKVLIIDFGMSKFVQNRQYFQQICGTPYYVAPEVIQGRYSEHCDMSAADTPTRTQGETPREECSALLRSLTPMLRSRSPLCVFPNPGGPSVS